MTDAEIYIGLFSHVEKDEALRQAAAYAGTAQENIRLVEVKIGAD